MVIRVFDCGTVLDCIKDILDEGHFPLPIERIQTLRREREIDPSVGYSTSSSTMEPELKLPRLTS